MQIRQADDPGRDVPSIRGRISKTRIMKQKTYQGRIRRDDKVRFVLVEAPNMPEALDEMAKAVGNDEELITVEQLDKMTIL